MNVNCLSALTAGTSAYYSESKAFCQETSKHLVKAIYFINDIAMALGCHACNEIFAFFELSGLLARKLAFMKTPRESFIAACH